MRMALFHFLDSFLATIEIHFKFYWLNVWIKLNSDIMSQSIRRNV